MNTFLNQVFHIASYNGNAHTPARFWDWELELKGAHLRPKYRGVIRNGKVHEFPHCSIEKIVSESKKVLARCEKEYGWAMDKHLARYGECNWPLWKLERDYAIGVPYNRVAKTGTFVAIPEKNFYFCDKDTVYLYGREDKTTGLPIAKTRFQAVFPGQALKSFNPADLDSWVWILIPDYD